MARFADKQNGTIVEGTPTWIPIDEQGLTKQITVGNTEMTINNSRVVMVCDNGYNYEITRNNWSWLCTRFIKGTKLLRMDDLRSISFAVERE